MTRYQSTQKRKRAKNNRILGNHDESRRPNDERNPLFPAKRKNLWETSTQIDFLPSIVREYTHTPPSGAEIYPCRRGHDFSFLKPNVFSCHSWLLCLNHLFVYNTCWNFFAILGATGLRGFVRSRGRKRRSSSSSISSSSSSGDNTWVFRFEGNLFFFSSSILHIVKSRDGRYRFCVAPRDLFSIFFISFFFGFTLLQPQP